MKYQTEMTFPVELTFEVLPAMLVEDTELPAQLDITKTLTEEQVMLFEDEIAENYRENSTF